MTSHDRSASRARHSFGFILMAVLLTILWVSGGASRADVIGQVIARTGAWAILIASVLVAERPSLGKVAPVSMFVFSSVLVVALQLVPLPPGIWTALPGRSLLEQAAIVTGVDQPWRPLSISPGATINALSSLVIPVATLFVAASLSQREHWRTAALLLSLIVASTFIGLLEFSGGSFDHPLINDVHGSVSASFANRNHFALFAAFGCVLAPAWAIREGHVRHWRAAVALALLLLFGLVILATGSRTGMLVGFLGVLLGVFNVRRVATVELRRLPRKVSLAILIGIALVLGGSVLISISLGRAVSLERAFALEAGEDLRRLALPTVWYMAKLYFPFGSGVGTFDPVYRIHEPDELLGFAYLNHAHSDLLEVILDAGLAGLVLLLSVLSWWLWRSVTAWRSNDPRHILARCGSGIFLLTLVASTTDYPARTPMIMAILVIAAVWLNGGLEVTTNSTASKRV